MITKEILDEIYFSVNKKITHCLELNNQSICNWDCCTYSDSYILLLPGEYKSAEALGYDMSRYEIIDENYNGGMKVVPKDKTCTLCMTNYNGKCGYKPLDCIFYPVWPVLKDGAITVIAGELCPIVKENKDLNQLIENFLPAWRILFRDADVRTFLEKSQMVGYKELKKYVYEL